MLRVLAVDFDGCLADTSAGLCYALNGACAGLGLRRWTSEETREMIGGGARRMLERAFEREGREFREGMFEEYLGVFLERYWGWIGGEREGRFWDGREDELFPGAREVLTQMKASGVRVVMCTNKRERFTHGLLGVLGARDLFEAVVCGDTTGKMKPDAEPLLEALGRVGEGREGAVMVGDGAPDVGAARAAGVGSVLVSFGFSPKPVGDLGADAIVDDWGEVPLAARGISVGGEGR